MKLLTRIIDRARALWAYGSTDVLSDTRLTLKVKVVRTLNITIRSFLSTDIQTQACAMTYRTLLAIVPALALLFAIGRGFGFQNLLQDELYRMLPSQKQLITHALTFVDSYLNQASEGIFVGVGLLFLLWTLIMLISNVEDSFNLIWGISQGRSIWRKITDYTAMLLILPVLMICGSGLYIFVNNTIQSLFDISFLTPVITAMFELGSYIFTGLFFTAVYMLIPNTKVRFYNALISGFFAGTAFVILQWLFVSGQLYVSKYNAIYGSFSFLPLLLLWLQLVWVITLTGALICYASQNVFQFSFTDQIKDISRNYYDKVAIAVIALAIRRFEGRRTPLTVDRLVKVYGIPARLASQLTDRLCDMGILARVVIDQKHQVYGFQPGIDPSMLTVGYVLDKLGNNGYEDFIPEFDTEFDDICRMLDTLEATMVDSSRDTHIADLHLPPPDKQPATAADI